MALHFAQDSVSLYERGPDGWRLIRGAATADADFVTQIDALRVAALVRAPASEPVLLWLPPEQILTRTYDLENKRPDLALAEAFERLSADTDYQASELCIALSAPQQGGPTTVVAALAQTVGESRHYAQRWGFVPGPVSTMGFSGDFDANGPQLRPPEPAANRIARTIAPPLAASVAAAAILIGGYSAIDAMIPDAPPASAVIAQAPPLAMMALQDQSVDAILRPLDATPRSGAAGLGIRQFVNMDAAKFILPNATHDVRIARAPDAPSSTGSTMPLLVGPALDKPARTRPARLGRLATIERAPLLGQLRQDAIAEQPVAAQATIADRLDDTSVQLASISATLAIPDLMPAQASRPAEISISFAPDAVTRRPVPRPAPTVEQTAETPSAPTKPEAVETGASQPVPEPAAAAPAEDTPTEAPTTLAVLSAPAPAPAKRPKTTIAIARTNTFKLPSGNGGLRTVRTAATENGLSLDQTSLIGVIDAKSGRKALVRTPSGDYRKLIRGDRLDGWKVSSIGREAVRLTKQGQNRTLLLISH